MAEFLNQIDNEIENYLDYNRDEIEEEHRVCSECDSKMTEGYCIDGGLEYYCSDKCLEKHLTKEEFNKLYDNGNGESYWTTWEE